jgi:hypothetical protein
MWLQTLLTEVTSLCAAASAGAKEEYEDRQRWIHTVLAVAGLRHKLPQTEAFANRRFTEPSSYHIIRDHARSELQAMLEQEGDRAYAGERLENDLGARAVLSPVPPSTETTVD